MQIKIKQKNEIAKELKSFKGGKGITKFISETANKFNVSINTVHYIYYHSVKSSRPAKNNLVKNVSKINSKDNYLSEICNEVQTFLNLSDLQKTTISEIEKMLKEDGIILISRKLQKAFSTFTFSPAKDFLNQVKEIKILKSKSLESVKVLEPDAELLCQELKSICEEELNDLMSVNDEKFLRDLLKEEGVINLSRKIERLIAKGFYLNKEGTFLEHLKKVSL